MASISADVGEPAGREPIGSASRSVEESAGRTMLDAMRALGNTRSIEDVAAVVRTAARRLLDADGATFVLKEGKRAYYLDEDAIAPLWKGQRFEASICISGMCMESGNQLVVDDIEDDPRIPQDLYRATFVRSLVMTPVRREAPIAAIGTYWASQRAVSTQELSLLQNLADAAALAIAHVQLVCDLERRVSERTEELSTLNAELEGFASIIAHDLRSPLSVVLGFGALIKEREVLPRGDASRDHLDELLTAAERMESIIGSLLTYTRLAKVPLHPHPLDLSALAREVCDRVLHRRSPKRDVQLEIEPELRAYADPHQLDILIEQLLDHSLKHTATLTTPAHVRIGAVHERGTSVFFMADNRRTFDQRQAEQMFAPYRPGSSRNTELGLATCARIVRRHDGRIWAEGTPNQGATIYFSLATPQVAS